MEKSALYWHEKISDANDFDDFGRKNKQTVLSKLYEDFFEFLSLRSTINEFYSEAKRTSPDMLRLILVILLTSRLSKINSKNYISFENVIILFSKYIDISYLLDLSIFNDWEPEKLALLPSKEDFIKKWTNKIFILVENIQSQGVMGFKRKTKARSKSKKRSKGNKKRSKGNKGNKRKTKSKGRKKSR